MANFIPYFNKTVIIPNVSANNIANLNNTLQGTLALNGALVNYDSTVTFNNYQTTVTITSAANINAVYFTITGYNKETLITETIQGPNATTVTSNNLFGKILSISASANINNAYTIGCNSDIAISVSYDMQSRVTGLYTISCPTTVAAWAGANAVLYGLVNTPYKLLLKNNLVVATHDIYLDIIQGGTSVITQANLNAGLFSSVAMGNDKELIFFITGGVVNAAGQRIMVSLGIG